jgi:predicted transposase YbfD/YdcC
MDYSTLPLPPLKREEGKETQLIQSSLYQALQALPDRRRGAGKRYPLPVLICLLLLAKMAGQTTLKGATEWVRLRAEPLASSFGLKRKAMPCQMTYKRMLEGIDAAALNELLAAFFTRWEAQQRCGEQPSRLQTPAGSREHRHVAIDGKAVRATSKQETPVHQLAAYDVQTGVVDFQVNVQDKENEISALKPLLVPSFIQGRIFSLDAMHTQTALCARLHRFGGYYILVAKDNQPTLAQDLADFFTDPPPDWRFEEAESWDKGHGRLEHRHLICSADLNEWLADRWVGVEQVFRLEQTTTLLKSGKERRQIMYGITNLAHKQTDAKGLLTLKRAHWGIEKRLHWRRDVTLGEDSCQTCTGAAPAILARFNSALLSLLDRLGVANVARQARFFDAHLEEALQALFSGHCSVY